MIFSYLLAAFIIMPIVEIAVLFKIVQMFDIWTTVSLVVLTGFLGAWLARAQGMMVLMAIKKDLAEGRMPAPRLMDGVMILIAGVLLITPGLITDIAGFLLLMPTVRAAIRQWLRRKLEEKIRDGSMNITFR